MTATLTILLIASACNGPGSSDGAGDETARNRIVEPVAPEWKLSLVEELRIGARLEGDETELLYRMADVEIGPGGEIYALSSGDRAVQVFSSTGEFLRTWGRGGEGPGEFRDPSDLALARDTVAVADRERVHFFDPAGRFLNSVWPGGQIGRYLVYSVHSTDPGWVVAVRPMQVAGEEPISPEGHFLGRIEDPDHFDPMILRDRQILAITSDELGVTYMVKYRVEGRFRES